MSGLNDYFQTFRKSSSSSSKSFPSQSVEDLGYEQSLEQIESSSANNNKDNDDDEDILIMSTHETKMRTFLEWKKRIKETVVQYITPRMFEEDGAQHSFVTEEDFHFAARIGFISASFAEGKGRTGRIGRMSLGQNGEDDDGDGDGEGESSMDHDHDHEKEQSTNANSHMEGCETEEELGAPQTQDGHGHGIHDVEAISSTPNSTSTTSKEIIIPGIHDAKYEVTSISELDLMTSGLSIEMNSVRLVWKKRKSKPQPSHGVSSDEVMPFPEEWMLQGPLHQNYKRVLTMEIMEMDDVSPIGSEHQREISNVARAAFGSSKTKRIRVFFYNFYADAITKLIDKAERATNCATMKSREAVRDKIIVSLRNIPPQCIFPSHHFHENGVRIHEKLSDYDAGRLAPYCICIGGTSNIKVNTPTPIPSPSSQSQSQGSVQMRKLRFDSKKLEIGVLIIGDDVNEYVVNQINTDELELGQRSEITLNEKGKMAKLYDAFKARESASLVAQSPLPQVGRSLIASAIPTTTPTPTAGRKRKASQSSRTYTLLSEVKEFYAQNSMKDRKSREICIYATVLNFTPPRRTKRNWMMNIMLFDDSLPCPREHDSGNNSNEAITSIPQMKIVIFRDNIQDFPRIECAGDVLRGHRVLVDEYRGEVHLTAFPWSALSLCRPTAGGLSMYEKDDDNSASTHTTITKDNWRHEEKDCNSLDFSRVNELWRFARKRMCSCPNVDAKYMFTNADIEKNINASSENDNTILGGDLTAMICAIIPYPEDKQTLHSPKGLLRVWDGTGVPHSDPLPENFSAEAKWISCEEPSQNVVLSISNIVQRMIGGRAEFKKNAQNEEELSDLCEPKCLCGKVINVVIWEAVHWDLMINRGDGISFVKVGQCIRLRNAIAKMEGSISSLHVNVNTSLTPIPDSSYEVKSLITNHHRRVQQDQPYNVRSALLPLILPAIVRGPLIPELFVEKQPNSSGACTRTLLDILLAPAPASFKVGFRVTDTKPRLRGQSLEEICLCNRKFSKFQFVINVRDPSIDLTVIVPNNVAEKIFGMTASQAKKEIGRNKVSSEQKAACEWMRNLTGQANVEGTINSVLVDNGTKYFVLSTPITY